MMSILDAKRSMFDRMKKYAGDKGAESSEALRGLKGVPIAHESVTIMAKPKPGEKLTPEEMRQKVGKLGLLPETDDLLEQMGGPTSTEALEEALEPVDSPEEELAERLRTTRR